MANIKTIFTNIANAIREKKGTTEKYLPENMSAAISTIETGGTGIDTSDATATPNDILLDKTAYVNGEKIVGTIQTYNNEHENGYVQINALKKLLDARKSAYSLFYNYQGTSVDGLIQYSDTENVTIMSNMFQGCSKLQTIPLLNTSNVIYMPNMFYECNNITTIPQLDTTNVTNMSYMFNQCTKLQNIPQLNTSNVTDMSSMFKFCKNLQTIPQLDTSNVTNMESMFYNCTSLQSIPQLDTSKVTNISYMFHNCTKLTTIDLTHMKFISLSSSNSAFYNCYSLTKLIIRTMTTIPVLSSDAFTNCYHFRGTTDSTYNPDGLKDGRIYVPDDKVDELKSATNWNVYADCIVPLSTLVE